MPDDRVRRVLLVGPGNVYLQNALTLLPNVELYGATPDQWASTTGKDRFDLVVFDGFLPDQLPAKPMLAIAPPRTSPLGSVVGTISGPAIGRSAVDEPLLANVDLSRLHVAQAQQMTLPDWARTVIPSGSDAPLLYSGVRDGLPTAVHRLRSPTERPAVAGGVADPALQRGRRAAGHGHRHGRPHRPGHTRWSWRCGPAWMACA